MNIGSHNLIYFTSSGDDLSTGLSERIRKAHDVAEAEALDSQAPASEPCAGGEGRPGVDSVGATLRTALEEIVSAVVAADRADPPNLLDQVVDVIVDDRFQRLDLGDDDHLRDQVFHAMRSDPTVIAELDDILQEIARQLAVTS